MPMSVGEGIPTKPESRKEGREEQFSKKIIFAPIKKRFSLLCFYILNLICG
jgi:hypothetical protein